jgi:NAD(P)-dependent dehydrogenase (short-subunit alcohol dehydrogenase family)
MAQRAALVTGASSGIGLAVAEVLLEKGYDVTVAARRGDKLAAAVAAFPTSEGTVHPVQADLTHRKEAVRLFAEHESAFGRLDVLVNNAGTGVEDALENISSDWVDRQIALNLRAVIDGYQLGLPLLERAGAEHGGAIVVNTASLAGKVAHAGLAVYTATKHGVVGLTTAMNLELASRGIKSCALCPGRVATPMTAYLTGELAPDDMIQVSDLAAAVRFLLELSRNCVVPEIMFHRPGVMS